MKVKLNISIEEDLKKMLNDYCKKNGLSASAVITILLRNFFAEGKKL